MADFVGCESSFMTAVGARGRVLSCLCALCAIVFAGVVFVIPIGLKMLATVQVKPRHLPGNIAIGHNKTPS